MSAHTPGPWKVSPPWINDDGKHFAVSTDYPEALCNGARSIVLTTGHGMHSKKVDATNEANARLIAAAPDMLAALKQIEDEINRTGSPSVDGWDKARAAIAKAEGRA